MDKADVRKLLKEHGLTPADLGFANLGIVESVANLPNLAAGEEAKWRSKLRGNPEAEMARIDADVKAATAKVENDEWHVSILTAFQKAQAALAKKFAAWKFWAAVMNANGAGAV